MWMKRGDEKTYWGPERQFHLKRLRAASPAFCLSDSDGVAVASGKERSCFFTKTRRRRPDVLARLHDIAYF